MSARGEFQRLRRSLRKAGACLDTGGQDAVRRAATEFRLAASAAAVLETAGALTFAQGALIHYPCASRVPAYRAVAQEAIRDLGNIEVVLVFRPVYSLFKVDHGFKSGCHTRWFGFVVIGFARGQDAMGRMGPFSIVVGQPLAYPQPRF